MGTTAKEIAKLAGVSAATVSNVLNGRKNVSEDTREQILALCKEHSYNLKPAAKATKSERSKAILFNFSDFDRQFYLQIIQGISDCAYSHDYDLIICTNRSCERFMSKNFTSGCIMLDMHCSDELLIKKACQGYPIVAMDRVLDEPFIKNFVVNNYDPMCALMEELVQRGYRRYAFLGGLDTEDTRERFMAFKDVLEKHRIPFSREHYLMGDFREKSGYKAAKLLLMSENLPEILVCASDNMAIGAMRAFRDEKIRVPEDIAITGFDDTQISATLGLTTVAIPNYERGYLAAQYLFGILEGTADYSTFKIQAKVRFRNTVLLKKE